MSYKHVILLFLLFHGSILAQQNDQKISEFYVGFSAGTNGSIVNFYPSIDQSFLLGVDGGVTFRYIGDKNVGIQAELNFSQRGWQEANTNFSKRMDYVELPFLTHIYIGRNAQFFINLGPKISYLISEKIKTNSTIDINQTEQIAPTYHPFDYGLTGGLGFLVKMNKQVVQLEGRFYYGLGNIFSNSKRDTYYFDSSNYLNASVKIGWLLQVK